MPVTPQDDLAAMITDLAQITAAQAAGRTWNDIAALRGYPSGRQAKKITRGLKARIRRELAAITARQAAALPGETPDAA
jgi:hypothetical protein